MMDALFSQIQQNLNTILFYLPLGIIGIWRWSVWAFKKAVGYFYRPLKNSFSASVSIITPVYNENPDVFKKALNSWRENKPEEIIAVIDYTDTKSIQIFKAFSKTFKQAKLIITKTPGKRSALADGIKAASGEILALVDSDTFWNEFTLKNALPPFADPRVAGVSPRQNVLKTETLAQKIFDIQLDLRYFDEFPFLAAAGDALVCISGRTAFYRREVILPMCADLINETFLGRPVISGDDKRLTYLVLKSGWKVAFQNISRVYTPGVPDLKTYLAQRLRWTRNGLRADIVAMLDGWSWKRPALAFFQIDKFLQSFAIILSPIYFFVSLYSGLYLGAALIFIWWFVSRTIKIYPHLKRKPLHITILPLYILYTFVNALLKIYAFFTLNTQGWITRWDKKRLPQFKFVDQIPAFALSMFLIFLLTNLVYMQKQELPLVQPQTVRLAEKQTKKDIKNLVATNEVQVKSIKELNSEYKINENGATVKKYIVQPGDTLSDIASSFNTDVQDVLEANINILPNWGRIEPGLILSIPYEDFKLQPAKATNYTIKKEVAQEITYDDESNTIHVFGRGTSIDLGTLHKKLGDNHLQEIKPKEWLLKSNIKIENGVSLNLNKKEVEWLKLQSNPKQFVWLKTWGGNIYIDGVKISSWDTTKNDFDKDQKDGRSFIMVKYNSRMDVLNSDLGYLGFYPHSSSDGSSYGVSWKLPDGTAGKYFVTGEVINSKFHHNYFGAYTYGATGMVWKNNEFYSNIEYGLDPHDDSNGFLVENNKFYSNGNHGIIFSKRCINNVIRGNISYNNRLHGIMLDRLSDNNIVENNFVYGNKDGIALYDSSNNIIRNNRIYDNQRGLRANIKSQNNVITNNSFSNNTQYGVYLYGEAGSNIVSNNRFGANEVALYIKTSSNQISNNNITKNKAGIYFIGGSSDNKIVNNIIMFNKKYGIYTKTSQDAKNLSYQNSVLENGKDL